MKQNKVKATYCKQHKRFDACAEQPGNSRLSDDQYVSKAAEEVAARLERLTARRKAGFGFKTRTPQDAMPVKASTGKLGPTVPTQRVAKAKDDGIHHLTGVERIKTSRVRTGGLVALETGRRKVDGTPRTGTGETSHRITSAVTEGVSGRSKPVGASRIREQIGKAAGNPFEVEEIAKMSTAELKEAGRQEKHRFKTEGSPTRFQRNFAGSKEYRQNYRADRKGGRLGAMKTELKEGLLHPVAVHGLNPNGGYRARAVQRRAALAHKAKKAGVSKAHNVFLGQD